jgi:hypothetical protein
MLDDIGASYRIPGAAVGANRRDRHVLAIEHHVLVITSRGEVFAHEVRSSVGKGYRLGGARVDVGKGDKWVLAQGRNILVVSADGRARTYGLDGESNGWEFRPLTVRKPVAITCPTPIGANAEDRRAVVRGRRLLVLTSSGAVGAHDIESDTRFGAGFMMGGNPRVGNLPQDKWILVVGGELVVVTADGQVFTHPIVGDEVRRPYRLSGPLVAANPQDRWVLPQTSRVLVVTTDGEVFAHPMFQQTPG